MGIIWRPVTEIKKLGVVVEQCLTCERMMPCVVRTVGTGHRILFVKLIEDTKETSCVCSGCGLSFPCQPWRYPTLVPAGEAAALPLEELLARTNPCLADRAELTRQVSALGGDTRFATAYEQLESMRPGELRAGLLKQLLDWGQLEEEQRAGLAQQVVTCVRAWQFARQVAPDFPGRVGCLPASLAALAVWSTFLWAPVVRSWWWGPLVGVAGLVAAAVTGRVLLARRVRLWTREVLIPEARRANVPLSAFLAVVDDLPEERLCVLDDLWPIKDQLDTIRGVLSADRQL
jgi:hypothetical protein